MKKFQALTIENKWVDICEFYDDDVLSYLHTFVTENEKYKAMRIAYVTDGAPTFKIVN